MTASSPRLTILWRQIWGLAALLAAIVFSWMAYGFYQPKILENLGFHELANSLGVIQGFLGAIVEPYVGSLSDRILQRVGSRLPLIATGVTLAGLLFVAVAGLIEHNPFPMVRWLIPVLMTGWVIAMIIFRGPAIALLMQFAPTRLPQASAILVFVFGLVGAIGPLLGIVLQRLGAPATFLIGSGVLLAGGLLLWSTQPHYGFIQPEPTEPVPFLQSVLIFTIGLGAGMIVNLLLRTVPPVLQIQFPNVQPEYLASGILLISALTALPLEKLTVRLGAKPAMLASLVAIVTLMGLMPWARVGWLTLSAVLAFGIAMGLLFISQIPFALAMVPPDQAGLGTGLYFGGMGAATAFVSLLLLSRELTPLQPFLYGVCSLGVAVLCLHYSSAPS